MKDSCATCKKYKKCNTMDKSRQQACIDYVRKTAMMYAIVSIFIASSFLCWFNELLFIPLLFTFYLIVKASPELVGLGEEAW